MSRRFSYCKNGKIKAFHEDLLIDINLRVYMHRFLYTSIVNKCGLLFTSSNLSYIGQIRKYFIEENINHFTGPMILIKFHEDVLRDYNKEDIYWIDNRNGVLKGEYKECNYFECGGYVVKIDKTIGFIEIFETLDHNFDKFLPYLIKILEGAIISQHIKLGFFPVHGGLISKNHINYLILGDSQAGKTTFMNILQDAGYVYLSDDIVFFDLYGRAYPFGHYKKVVKNIIEDNSFYENNEGVIRKVDPISNIGLWQGVEIHKVLLPAIKHTLEYSLTPCFDPTHTLTQFLSDYPAGYFVWEEYMFSRSINTISELEKKKIYQVALAYERPNKGVEQLWEEKAILQY